MQKNKLKLKSGLTFAIGYLKNPKKVGTIFRSSKSLSKKVASYVTGEIIVEFGSGTGEITIEILKKMQMGSKLYCFELDKKYCELMEKKFSKQIYENRLEIINDSAENILLYLDSFPDCIVSGLPLASLDKRLVVNILNISKNVEKYVQYQYSPFSKKLLKKYFKKVDVHHVLRNPVPATVYVCSNLNIIQ